jgi:FkbM family methyltransferase
MKTLLKPLFDAVLYRWNKFNLKKQQQQIAGLTWFSIKKLKHDKSDHLKVHRSKIGDLYYTQAQQLYHGLQEVLVDEIYKVNLASNARIIDCGANIGLSVLYFKSICPSAHITAFEPDRHNFELLTKNCIVNNLKQVDLVEAAVWKENTQLKFIAQGGMDSKISEGAEEGILVKAYSLIDYLQDPVDFLKLDIEGAEFEVLKNIEEYMDKIATLFIEYHGSFSQTNELIAILDMVQKAGFYVYIKEACNVYPTPFYINSKHTQFDVQLNIFCRRTTQD